MRPAPGLTVSAPSSSLLRFLRAQSEQICFFTPSRAATCQNPQTRTTPSNQQPRNAFLTGTRSLTTTRRHQANVESSLLNLDFLRPAAKHVLPNFLTLESAQRPWAAFPPRIAPTYRHGSTDSRPLLGRLWKQEKRKEKSLKPTDLPPLPSFLDEFGGTNLGRNKTGKPGNELKLRCTEFDANGNVTLMDGEFKKSELIAKVRTLSSEASGQSTSIDSLYSTVFSPATSEKSIPPSFHTSSSAPQRSS